MHLPTPNETPETNPGHEATYDSELMVQKQEEIKTLPFGDACGPSIVKTAERQRRHVVRGN